MGLFDLLRRLFTAGPHSPDAGLPPDLGYDVHELARRLDLRLDQLRAIQPACRTFTLPKRRGGQRTIAAPEPELKAVQRRILRRLLARLRAHPAAVGFERGQSIVTNALPHVGRDVIVKMDLRDFFGSTRAGRVHRYFRKVGWNRDAAALLTRLCTYKDALPQGAPTSPRLSNLLNRRLDARLAGLARRFDAHYTRYADDLTFSFADDAQADVHELIGMVGHIVRDEGYALHTKKKLRIARRHDRQSVTGLVVNDWPILPRETRRWLRAVEHRLATGREATLTPAQLQGWHALQDMIARGTHRAEA